jgi:U3 small nucleolar RNA-associated protein 14
MKSVLEHGELVAASLEFGNSNAISTSGEIEIDLGGDKPDPTDMDEAPVYVEEKLETRVAKPATLTDAGTSEFVSTFAVIKGASKPSQTSNSDKAACTSNRNKIRSAAPVTPAEPKVEADNDESNPWMTTATSTNASTPNKAFASKKSKKGVVDIAGAAHILDAGKTERNEKAPTDQEVKNDSEETQTKKITSLTQEELVRTAFVGLSDKEIDEDFQKEKDDMAAENDPTRKVEREKTPDEVAGWGSWTGQGALPPKPRKLPKRLQPPPKKKEEKRKRLDDAKPGVIINQKRLKKTANTFMLGDVPHPYANRAEYEQAMLGGVGKEWNVSSSFKNMTRPEILTRAGKIIQPISKKVKAPRPAAKF